MKKATQQLRNHRRLWVEPLETREMPALALALGTAFGSDGGGNDNAESVHADSAGNFYLTGNVYGGTTDFDIGPGTYNVTGSGAYIAKYSAAGIVQWAYIFASGYASSVKDVSVDSAGNVILVGTYLGTADFDPGPGVFTLTQRTPNFNGFILKLDSNGNFIWCGDLNDAQVEPRAIELDASGNIYIAGNFWGQPDFDPGAGVFRMNALSSYAPFVLKLDNSGVFQWAVSIPTTSYPMNPCPGLGLDAAGNVYIAGGFEATGDFDPGPGTVSLTSAGYDDIFVVKFDNNGNYVWARQIGSTNGEQATDVSADAAGNVYLTGEFGATVDFDPGAGVFNLTSQGNSDIFLCKLDTLGNLAWAYSFGTGPREYGTAIAVTPAGEIAAMGGFGGTIDFDPGPGVYNVSPWGIYILRLDAAGNFVGAGQIGGAAGSYYNYGIAWDNAGAFYVTGDYYYGDLDPGPGVVNANGQILFGKYIDIPGNVYLTQTGGSTDITEGGASDQWTVVLAARPIANVNVSFTADSQSVASPASLTFTTANWNVPQTVTIGAVNDVAVEGNHNSILTGVITSSDINFNGTLAPVTAHITDDDANGVTVTPTTTTDVSEAGLSDIYSVVLNAAPTSAVSITVNPGAELTVVPAILTFTPASWNIAQAVTVQAIDDAIAQGTRSQTITHTATSSDPGYNAIAIAAVTVNITDNDTAGLTLSSMTVDLTEGGTSNIYTAVLNSQPTANVVITLTGDSQVSPAVGTLIFTPGNWNVPQVVRVSALDDTLAEGLHNGLIAHTASSVDPAYSGMTRTVTARITDNENPGVLISQTNGLISILEGSSKTYTAVLNSPPSSDVVLNINPDSQVSVSPASITFTPSDWNVPRPVVVTANDDGIEEGDNVGRITHATSSASAAFNNLSVASVTASIVDNDGAAAFGTERADQILVSFTPANIKVTVNGKLTTLPPTLTQLLLYAGFGNDSIQVLAPTIPVVIIGGPGVDKVFVTGQTASNTFVLGDSAVTANGQSIGVWEAESLTVAGKAGNDTFAVQGVPAFPVELKGDAGSDLVVGPNRPNTWQITGVSAGTLDTSIKISAMENWTGGDDADSFVFTAGKSIAGQVDGGLGQNTLDFSAATAAITVNLQNSVATGSKRFANITSVVGGKGSADKLIAADQSNLWNITAANSGSVVGVTFRNFENLTGGALDDTFLLADNQGIKGKIDGGSGLDLLDYSAYLSRPVLINVQIKAATGTAGFANVERFSGGSGTADTLTGPNKVNAWHLTGSGQGTISGAAFSNFENLTGGTLADTFTLDPGSDWLGLLNGGSGQDVLVAPVGQSNLWINTGLNAGTLNGRKFTGIESRR